MTRRFNVAVVGATGAVGRTMLRVLEERQFPTAGVKLLASARSAGAAVPFAGESLTVEELGEHSFAGIDIALFSPGASVSAVFAPIAAKAGAIVVDNTSYFRMDPDVPLVVPEVNPEAIAGYKTKGIIANPNCSTIQLMPALKPLSDRWGLKRVVVDTYQSVSGAGQKGLETLKRQTEARVADVANAPGSANTAFARAVDAESLEAMRAAAAPAAVDNGPFAHPIAFEALPQIDKFMDDGFTKEEWKVMNESRKILGLPDLRIVATTVRVPVAFGHSESVTVEFERPFGDLNEVRDVWRRFPNVIVRDEPAKGVYPLTREAAGTDPVYVGRLRRDPSVENGVVFWCVADNVRKGAATNAVQIAEYLASRVL